MTVQQCLVEQACRSYAWCATLEGTSWRASLQGCRAGQYSRREGCRSATMHRIAGTPAIIHAPWCCAHRPERSRAMRPKLPYTQTREVACDAAQATIHTDQRGRVRCGPSYHTRQQSILKVGPWSYHKALLLGVKAAKAPNHKALWTVACAKPCTLNAGVEPDLPSWSCNHIGLVVHTIEGTWQDVMDAYSHHLRCQKTQTRSGTGFHGSWRQTACRCRSAVAAAAAAAAGWCCPPGLPGAGLWMLPRRPRRLRHPHLRMHSSAHANKHTAREFRPPS